MSHELLGTKRINEKLNQQGVVDSIQTHHNNTALSNMSEYSRQLLSISWITGMPHATRKTVESNNRRPKKETWPNMAWPTY